MTTRVVQIEAVEGLDTDACLMELTRFKGMRGRPHTIGSDNGTNFVDAAREFREKATQMDQTAVFEAPAQQKVAWNFNLLEVCHFGGVW